MKNKNLTAFIESIPEVTHYQNLMIRKSDDITFINVIIQVKPDLTNQQAHTICDKVEEVRKVIKRSDVFVHAEPEGEHNY